MLNFGLLWEKCHFYTAVAIAFPRVFVTVGPGGKETREREQGERKRDLGEKKKISGAIKVKSSLHDHFETSAPQKMHSRADRLARTLAHKHTCAHTIITHTHKQDD